jgi:hypothetical protein
MKEGITQYLESKGFKVEYKDDTHFVAHNFNVNGRYIGIQGDYDQSGKYYCLDIALRGTKHNEYEESIEYDEGEESAEKVIHDIKMQVTDWVGKF